MLIKRLGDLMGNRMVAEADEMAPFLVDERDTYQGAAACMVFPDSTEEVAAVLKLCEEYDHAVVPQGGNTGYCGGATPTGDRQVLLNLSRMNRIRAIDPLGMTATVEAGVVLADLHTAVEEKDLFFPLSMGSEGSCQIGGNLSTNAGGLAVLKYGMAGELVLGLEVVLADGTVLDWLKPLRKDNTGYHLQQLFLGAEGTLGVITAAVLKLFPRPTEFQTAWLAIRDIEAACTLLPLARRASGDTVTSFEYVSGESLALVNEHIDGASLPPTGNAAHQLLIELSGPLPPGKLREPLEKLLTLAVEKGLAVDGVIAESGPQRDALWQLRESIPEAEKRAGRSIKHDVSVPIADIPAFCDRARERLAECGPLRLSVYGHIGDGNLHYNVLASKGEDADDFRSARGEAISRAVHDLAMEMGGSFSAEHGVGQLKREELARYASPQALAIMRSVKAALDPDGRMNPGKLIEN